MNHSINLYNPALRKHKLLFSATQMVSGLILVFFGVIAFYAYTTHMEEGLRRQEVDLGKVLSNSQTQLVLLASNLTAKTTSRNLSSEIQTQEQQLSNRRQLFLALSGRLSRNHGYSRYLRAFARQSLEGLWLLAFSVDASNEHLKIRGRSLRAELIPRYLHRLGQESVLEGRHFAALELIQVAVKTSTVASRQVIEFTLSSKEGEPPR